MKPERRTVPRERLFQPARIVFNGGQSMLGCSVRNRSQTGALMRLTDWIALPATFAVETPGDAVSRRVRLCWRRGDDVGVAFLTAQDDRPDAPIDLAAFRAKRDISAAG